MARGATAVKCAHYGEEVTRRASVRIMAGGVHCYGGQGALAFVFTGGQWGALWRGRDVAGKASALWRGSVRLWQEE